MSELLPYLLRPFWLIALPLPVWLLWRLWHRQRQTGRWQRLLPKAFHAALLTRGKLRNSRLPWVLLGLAWLTAWLALLGPSWQRIEQPSLSLSDPMVIVLETTPAMLATDIRPSRFEQAKRKILDLLEERGGAQTAVVVFAGSAHTLVPLSNDRATTQNLLDALKPDLMPDPGHRADLAVAQGVELLKQGANGRGRILLIGSGLSDHEQLSIQKQLRNARPQLLILGIGTEQGAPIPREDGSFLKNERGAIIIPRLDNNALRRFASNIGGHYQQVRVDDADLRNLELFERSGDLQAQDESTRLDAWQDQGYWLMLPLLLLAALAGRRGWLFCLPLLVFNPQYASAVNMDDLWWRPDQQGIRLLESGHPEEAAERFRHDQWQGYARYQAGDYAGAAAQFAKGDSAADHYNRGNALARHDELQAAIEAYEQALEIDPELEAARHNKALVEQALRQQQQAQDDGNSDAPDTPDQPPEAESAQPAPAGTKGPATSPAEPDETTTQAPAEDSNEASSEATVEAPAEEDAMEAEQLSAQAQDATLDPEQDQAMNQWLRRIPDDPGELLRRKFLLEQRKRQELNR